MAKVLRLYLHYELYTCPLSLLCFIYCESTFKVSTLIWKRFKIEKSSIICGKVRYSILQTEDTLMKNECNRGDKCFMCINWKLMVRSTVPNLEATYSPSSKLFMMIPCIALAFSTSNAYQSIESSNSKNKFSAVFLKPT
ncbi:hypothetical protein T01_13622 [Trichinella spiralis]|uniref:Uncharacterized protein n=1 Tax=Trichinella spiralis TaxID=6334 RepID=A0A0V1BPW3_TRISP|nr:hypothetical protein T01_13622 [Trichinella spiralis]